MGEELIYPVIDYRYGGHRLKMYTKIRLEGDDGMMYLQTIYDEYEFDPEDTLVTFKELLNVKPFLNHYPKAAKEIIEAVNRFHAKVHLNIHLSIVDKGIINQYGEPLFVLDSNQDTEKNRLKKIHNRINKI